MDTGQEMLSSMQFKLVGGRHFRSGSSTTDNEIRQEKAGTSEPWLTWGQLWKSQRALPAQVCLPPRSTSRSLGSRTNQLQEQHLKLPFLHFLTDQPWVTHISEMIWQKRECSFCEVMLGRCLSTVVSVFTCFHAQHLIKRQEAFNTEERAVASTCIIQDFRN